MNAVIRINKRNCNWSTKHYKWQNSYGMKMTSTVLNREFLSPILFCTNQPELMWDSVIAWSILSFQLSETEQKKKEVTTEATNALQKQLSER